MSAMNLPGPMPTAPPPAGAPGQPSVGTDQAREAFSLRVAMSEAFTILGSELKKPQPDPVALLKAQGMLRQIQSQRPQAPQAQPSGVDLVPQTGIPRPVDRMVDATTGMAPQTGQAYSPTR